MDFRRGAAASAVPLGSDLLQQSVGMRFDRIVLDGHVLGVAGQPFGIVVFAPRQQALRLFHQQSGIFMAIAFRIPLALLGHQAVVAIQQGFDFRRAVFHRSVDDAGCLRLLQLACRAMSVSFGQSLAGTIQNIALRSGPRRPTALRVAASYNRGRSFVKPSFESVN